MSQKDTFVYKGTSYNRIEFINDMSFADIVEEVRHLPIDEQLELQEILEHNLISLRREEIYKNHLETLEDLKQGKVVFTSDVDELMKQIKSK